MATDKNRFISEITKKYTRVLQCSPASVGLAQARPN